MGKRNQTKRKKNVSGPNRSTKRAKKLRNIRRIVIINKVKTEHQEGEKKPEHQVGKTEHREGFFRDYAAVAAMAAQPDDAKVR